MKPIITVDLGFGDSGKGTIVDALVRRYGAEMVVRYNGGCQAGHNVYADGAHHTFSQIGSGAFVPKTYTFLSQFMLVNPLLLMIEAERLESKGVREAINRVFIDDRCLVITPYHRAMNRLREMVRGDAKHGSCGTGIGECVAHSLAHPEEALRIGDFHKGGHAPGKLFAIRDRLMKEAHALPGLPDGPDSSEVGKQLSTFAYDIVKLSEKYNQFYKACGSRCIDEYTSSRLLSQSKVAIFEAAQGVLLDEKFGFHPHTTWSNTTMQNAKLLLEEAEITDKPYIIGIIRSFMTRHGAGPMPTESRAMTRKLTDPCNPRNKWQDALRCGPLDLPLIGYALRCNGPVDGLAVTHMDVVDNEWPICLAYDKTILAGEWTSQQEQERRGKELEKVHPVLQNISEPFTGFVEQLLKTPVVITSNGNTAEDKQYHHALAAVGKI
jgi:adenylosuccinate synthase